MPLHHLLYRCPVCGHDPTTPDGHGARCGACGARFDRGESASIVTTPASGPTRADAAADLVDAIGEWEGKSPSGFGADGRLDYSADVTYKRVVGQGTVYHSEVVAGFYETFSALQEGHLHISSQGVALSSDDGESFNWLWADVRAVQTSSRSLQLNLKPDGLFDFRFADDSPRRWEDLLHSALQAFYEASGERIREFQPRIVSVPIS